MENYERLILEFLNGESPREKYDYLMYLDSCKNANFRLGSESNMYRILVNGLYKTLTEGGTCGFLKPIESIIMAHHENINGIKK